MKTYFFTFLIVLLASVSFAGNGTTDDKNATKLVTGKIIDKESGEEIAGAEITIGGQKIYSDLNGNFSISIPMVQQKAIVKFISYTDAEISIDPVSYTPVIIPLSGK